MIYNKMGTSMKKIENITSLIRSIVRESLSRAMNEGGHGGNIEYVVVPKLFQVLENYSTSGGLSRDKIVLFIDSLRKICDSTPSLTAYSGRYESGSSKTPINRAYSVIERMYNPEVIAQFGEPNIKLVEKQVMDALGASFYSGEDPKTGFIGILGATLGWTGYPDPKTPAAMVLSKSGAPERQPALQNLKKI